MHYRAFATAVLLSSTWTLLADARCDAYSPAFALPSLDPESKEIQHAYHAIKQEVEIALVERNLTTLSYSVVVTSSSEILFDFHHTAVDRDKDRPGTENVDGSSVYRIASNTKPFTVLALFQLQKAGKLNLDDPVNKYLPELDQQQTGSLPWKDITLRTLATQLSGIPRNLGMVDLKDNPAWQLLGLPDLSNEHLVVCDSIWNYTKSCTTDDLYSFLRGAEPFFAPKQKSTYGNINFVLLGRVIEKLSNMTYEDYIERYILRELQMSNTTFRSPADANAVLPKGMAGFFDMYMEVQNPTGGLYSTTNDMAQWVQYILTNYNGITPTVNWLNPQSFATGLNTFYGIPWEIYRTDTLLPYTERPVTFVTKGGGWPGYMSITAMVPEYGIGFVIFVGSNETFGDLQATIASSIGVHIVEAAEAIAQKQLSQQHTGIFSAPKNLHINSSITLSHSLDKGLYISSWTSNSIDVLAGYRMAFMGGDLKTPMRLQLVPTLLFKDEEHKRGEIWRIHLVQGDNPEKPDNTGPLNKYFCVTDTDTTAFGGKPIEEVVFWSQGADGVYDTVELTGWRIRLERSSAATKSVNMEAETLARDAGSGGSVLQRLFKNIGIS